MESKISKTLLEEFGEWRLPEYRIAEEAVTHRLQAADNLAGEAQAEKGHNREEIAEITSKVENTGAGVRNDAENPAAREARSLRTSLDPLPGPIEPNGNGPKPANFIPRDGLLARCVSTLRAEGYSQARIARELRLNKRTVSRLLKREA